MTPAQAKKAAFIAGNNFCEPSAKTPKVWNNFNMDKLFIENNITIIEIKIIAADSITYLGVIEIKEFKAKARITFISAFLNLLR